MKKKGSALIVAMLLIAGVGAVAFGIGRLLFVETTTATLYENGIGAYYAAESGIEEGFLRYKFDQNASVPATVPGTIDLSDDAAFRTNLEDKTVVTNSHFSTLVSVADKGKQFYDLRMSNLGTNAAPWYGNDVFDSIGDGNVTHELTKEDLQDSAYAMGDYSNLEISKDSSAKVDLTNIPLASSTGAKLMLLFEGDMSSQINKCHAMAELKITVEDTASITREFKELTNYNPTVCAGLLGFDQNKLFPASITSIASDNTTYLYYEVDLQGIFTRAGFTLLASSTQITLSVRPLYSGAKYGLYASTCNIEPNLCTSIGNIIPGPFTTVTSRGYYGGVTRTLTANVDRQSGTLYDLFDYVIFKEN